MSKNSIIPLGENEIIDKDITSISPYDDSYPVKLLSYGIEKNIGSALEITSKACTELMKATPIVDELGKGFDVGMRLVLDASKKTLSDIEKGKIKLCIENGNKTYAQIRNQKGYGKKIPIKKEYYSKGINPTELANAMQMVAMQEQLMTISKQLNTIDCNVKEAIQGMQNDRIALYYSGESLYIEAMNISDESLKNALIAQALKELSTASFQLTLEMQNDIDYLMSGKYQNEKGKKVQIIDERIRNINKSFLVIHQATLLKAAIYVNKEEMNTASIVLKEYSRFIESNISNNAARLAMFDKTDNGTETGTWNNRAKLKLDTLELSNQLENKTKEIYLDLVEEKHEKG